MKPVGKQQLYVVDAIKKKNFRTSTENVAVERDFHRIEIDGVKPDAFESALSAIESEFASVLVKVGSERTLDDRHCFDVLLNLLALCAVKNPRHRAMFAGFQAQVATLLLDSATSSPEIWKNQMEKLRAEVPEVVDGIELPYEKIREHWTSGKFKITTRTEMHLQMEMSVFSEVLEVLARRRWSLLRCNLKATGFVTADHPVCLYFSDPFLRNNLYGVGYGLAGTEVLFPITNDLALLGTFEGTDRVVDISIASVAQANTIIAAHAERQVYSRDCDFVFLSSRGQIKPGVDLERSNVFQRPRRK